MKSRILFAILFVVLFVSCKQEQLLTQYVNPFVGTDAHGHTYPGAALPFGFMQLSPDTRLDGWDGCSGYHYSDSLVYGFSHTHLSGTGVSDYADILFMPTTGKPLLQRGSLENYQEGYASLFQKENETAKAGFYSTFLDKYAIKVELTATERAGFHKYIFPQSEQANIILDLQHRDEVLDSYLKVVSNTQIEGYRHSKAWASNQQIYFVAQFSKPFDSFGIALNDTLLENLNQTKGKNVKAFFTYKTQNKETILVRIGISAVDIEGARKNLEAEINHWDFEKTKQQANLKWNAELSKIQVSSSNAVYKEIFYTSLYHSFLNPNVFTDVDGRFRGRDLKVHTAERFTNYTVFSLWDTYRALHPLFTLVQQERTNDFVQTFLTQYQQGGLLPVWEFSGNETFCMIGYHSAAVIVDAYVKGIRNFDAQKALEAMKYSATRSHFGLEAYQKFGFIPINHEHESVSKQLEYAYDDWCIAQMAKAINDTATYNQYISRAQYYKNLFDPQTGFMRPKINGSWLSPFDAREVNFNYTEANAWQYSFYVPHDVSGLMRALGGKEAFAQKLDALFTEKPATTGRTQPDITGLIGQYAHGNEPSHHMAYLYNYAGKAWKTQQRVHQILTELYTNKPDGLSGNEDCGQMSAWYVMSSMGFYPVTPASDIYVIGTPLFDEVKLNAGKKPFVIKAHNLSPENFYIQSAKLNGVAYNQSFIKHQTLLDGGELVFEMGNKPNLAWASADNEVPISSISERLLLPVPYIEAQARTFYDSLVLKLSAASENTQVFYTTDGSLPNQNSLLYQEPLLITQSTTLKAIAIDSHQNKSLVVTSEFFKTPRDRKISIKSKYNRMFTAGGEFGLIDFIRGSESFTSGNWQGYQNQDFEAVVDLGKNETVSKVGAGFLQEIRSWIWMPTRVEFWGADKQGDFRLLGTVANTIPDNEYNTVLKDFWLDMKPQSLRYLKVKAINYGTIPEWHLGKGGEAFIFIDEIMIND